MKYIEKSIDVCYDPNHNAPFCAKYHANSCPNGDSDCYPEDTGMLCYVRKYGEKVPG